MDGGRLRQVLLLISSVFKERIKLDLARQGLSAFIYPNLHCSQVSYPGICASLDGAVYVKMDKWTGQNVSFKFV